MNNDKANLVYLHRYDNLFLFATSDRYKLYIDKHRAVAYDQNDSQIWATDLWDLVTRQIYNNLYVDSGGTSAIFSAVNESITVYNICVETTNYQPTGVFTVKNQSGTYAVYCRWVDGNGNVVKNTYIGKVIVYYKYSGLKS